MNLILKYGMRFKGKVFKTHLQTSIYDFDSNLEPKTLMTLLIIISLMRDIKHLKQ